MRVAQSLVNMKKNKEAIEMLDLYIHYFPDSKIPFDMYMLPFAEIYYRAGANDKGNKLVERIGKICSDNLDYYYSYGLEKSYFEQDIQTSLGILKRLGMLASANKETALAAKMDTLFNMKIRMFE